MGKNLTPYSKKEYTYSKELNGCYLVVLPGKDFKDINLSVYVLPFALFSSYRKGHRWSTQPSRAFETTNTITEHFILRILE